jgi:hypothetical protein
MENRIKEQQMDMFADRTSTAHLKSNQLRLWFSTFAYLLMRQVRSIALAGSRLAKATVSTIRLQLMKIAAQVHLSVRRVKRLSAKGNLRAGTRANTSAGLRGKGVS